jgi:hypothetical protein
MNKADKRAEVLLRQCLSPEQLSEFEANKAFFVQSSTGKTYLIGQGLNHNVSLIKNGERTVTYCAGPEGVPWGDYALSQKLWLENDEEAFLRVSNYRLLKFKPSDRDGSVLVLGEDDFRTLGVNIRHFARPVCSFGELEDPIDDGWQIDVIGQAGLGYSLQEYFSGQISFSIRLPPYRNDWIVGMGYLDSLTIGDTGLYTNDSLIKYEITIQGNGSLERTTTNG